MGVHEGGDDSGVPGAPGHPHEKDRGPGAPQPPAFPGPPAPVVTESGGAPRDGHEEATKALDDTAAATREGPVDACDVNIINEQVRNRKTSPAINKTAGDALKASCTITLVAA